MSESAIPPTTTEDAPIAVTESAEAPANGQVTAADEEDANAATEAFNSVKVSLADLSAKGTSQFAHKNYGEAAECFARAAELQAELNGEMAPENAEILFLYGRSLFKVGQGKSDVLGGKAGGEKKKPKGAAKPKKSDGDELEKITEEGVAIVAEKNGAATELDEAVGAKKPLFQFTGDENFEDSDDDDGDVSYSSFLTFPKNRTVIGRLTRTGCGRR
jgi:HAT1-interacting factor 1